MKWDNYFGKIYCVFFLPNRDRFFRLDAEFQRVGLKDSKNFSYEFVTPSSFDAEVLAEIHKKPHLPIFKAAYANQLRNFEILAQRALANNSDLTLVLEDDIAFLKDLSRIEKIVATMPKGFHVYQMDKFVPPEKRAIWDSLCKTKQINSEWVDATKNPFMSAACNAYTKEGLKEMLHIARSMPGSIDQFATKCSLPWAIAKENVSVQLIYNNSVNMQYASKERLYACYSTVDYSKYNCPFSSLKGEVL